MAWIRNKRTGEVIQVPDGGQQALPANPLKVQGAQLDNQSKQANMANDAARLDLDRQRLALQQQQQVAEAQSRQQNAALDARKAEVTAPIRQQALTDFQSALDLAPIVDELEQKFNAGPGQTRGLSGLGSIIDRLPLPRNEAFDSASNKLRGFVKKAQGFTGGEGNTAAEAQMNIGAFIPSSKDYDTTTRQNLKALRGEQQRGMRSAVSVLGGIPDTNGQVTPVPTGYRMGQYPALDVAISKQISTVPAQARARFIVDAMRRFEQKQAARKQPAPGRSAPKGQSRVIDFNDLPE